MKSIFKAARALVFGGCRHKKMGWPIWLGGYAYRVCLDCGIKRLFDEETLSGYGPYSYQIQSELMNSRRGSLASMARNARAGARPLERFQTGHPS